jgi:hypothetical protein
MQHSRFSMKKIIVMAGSVFTLFVGVCGMPQKTFAASAVTVQFLNTAEQSVEDGGAVASVLAFTNSFGQSVSHPKMKVLYQITGTASTDDYVFNHAPGIINGSIEIAAGSGNVSVLFGHIADTVDEPNETVVVKLTGVSYTGNTPVVVGANKIFTDTIIDDDPSTYYVNIEAPVSESLPEYKGSLVYFSVKDQFGNNVAHGDLSLDYQITGTANSSDFSFNGSSAMTGSVLIPAGNGVYAVGLDTANYNDNEFEPDESVVISITGIHYKDADPRFIIGQSNVFTRIIVNDDFPHYVEFQTTSASITEGQGALVVLDLTDASGNYYWHPELYVNYQISGTADSSDFVFNGSSAYANTVVIPAGSGPYTVALAAIDDYLVEYTESISVAILSVSDEGLGTDQRVGNQAAFVGTIIDNDVRRFVQFANVSTVSEEDFSGFNTNYLTFTDQFGNSIGRPEMDIYYQITGTASSSDYVSSIPAASNVVHIYSGGVGSLPFDIFNIPDELVENNESVIITITGVVSYEPGFSFEVGPSNSWTHIILNDDTQLYLQLERASISSVENQPTLNDFIWMKLVDDNGNTYFGQDPITINYQYLGGTANPADDFTINGVSSALSGSVTLSPAGNGKYAFPLFQVYDDVVEPDETAIINIVGAVSENNPHIVISRGEFNSFTYTIVNDDWQ